MTSVARSRSFENYTSSARVDRIDVFGLLDDQIAQGYIRRGTRSYSTKIVRVAGLRNGS